MPSFFENKRQRWPLYIFPIENGSSSPPWIYKCPVNGMLHYPFVHGVNVGKVTFHLQVPIPTPQGSSILRYCNSPTYSVLRTSYSTIFLCLLFKLFHQCLNYWFDNAPPLGHDQEYNKGREYYILLLAIGQPITAFCKLQWYNLSCTSEAIDTASVQASSAGSLHRYRLGGGGDTDPLTFLH